MVEGRGCGLETLVKTLLYPMLDFIFIHADKLWILLSRGPHRPPHVRERLPDHKAQSPNPIHVRM